MPIIELEKAELEFLKETILNKPFSGFSNFEECVSAQQEKGHSIDSAKRVCGFLMHRTEKEFLEGTNTKSDDTQPEDPKCQEKQTDEAVKNKSEPVIEKSIDGWPADFVKELDKPKVLNKELLKKENIIKTEVFKLKDKTQKADTETQDDMPDSEDDQNKNASEDRLTKLEKGLDTMKSDVSKIVTLLEDEKKAKKQFEEGRDDEKTPPKDEEDKDKKKEVGTKPVNPAPEGGETGPLPKATGETDETAPPAGNSGDEIVEKEDLKKAMSEMMDEKFKEFAKSIGINKTETPRPNHEARTPDTSKTIKKDLPMDFIKRSREGTLTAAEMNRETKEIYKADHDARLQAMLNAEVQ